MDLDEILDELNQSKNERRMMKNNFPNDGYGLTINKKFSTTPVDSTNISVRNRNVNDSGNRNDIISNNIMRNSNMGNFQIQNQPVQTIFATTRNNNNLTNNIANNLTNNVVLNSANTPNNNSGSNLGLNLQRNQGGWN